MMKLTAIKSSAVIFVYTLKVIEVLAKVASQSTVETIISFYERYSKIQSKKQYRVPNCLLMGRLWSSEEGISL